MSKTTRITEEQLKQMGLEEVSDGVFAPVKKQEFQDGTKGSFKRLEDGKIEFTHDDKGKWEIVNRPNDAEPLYYMGADPASDEPSHSVVVKRLPNGDIFMSCCRPCHNHIHDNSEWPFEKGFLISKHE